MSDTLADAIAHHQAGRLREAIAIYERLIAEGQGNSDILNWLASAFRSDGSPGRALKIYGELEATFADRADFWFNRGNALSDIGRFDEADASFARAAALEPENAGTLVSQAIARARMGDEDGAILLYRQALALEPANSIAAHNLANLLADRGELAESTTLLRQVVRHSPDLAEAHYNLGRLLLRLGDYTAGSAEYEWRWQVPGDFGKPDYRRVPVWDGRPFPGKRLVVHAEQGLGDAIQFSKLLGLVKSLGGDVVLHVPAKLVALLRSLPFDIEVTGSYSAAAADFQIPLMSLLHKLKLTPGSIPRHAPYLSASPDRVQYWVEKLGLEPGAPAIGFVWQGNPDSPVEGGRSLSSPAELEPFTALEGVRLIALQKLDASALEQAPTPSGWKVGGLPFLLEAPGPDLDAGADTFVDTAAIMQSLGLVVSVCTAPLHLAGALGRPVIGLLKSVPDWRWGMQGETTPWYPTMMLERQTPGEDYAPAIARAVDRARGILNR